MSIFHSPFTRSEKPFKSNKKTVKCSLAGVRSDKKLTQQEIAEDLRLSKSMISEIEHQRKLPSLYTALRLAALLETTVEELFSLDAEKGGLDEMDELDRETLRLLKETHPDIPWEDSFHYANKRHY